MLQHFKPLNYLQKGLPKILLVSIDKQSNSTHFNIYPLLLYANTENMIVGFSILSYCNFPFMYGNNGRFYEDTKI